MGLLNHKRLPAENMRQSKSLRRSIMHVTLIAGRATTILVLLR
jgi:hypothetical protein